MSVIACLRAARVMHAPCKVSRKAVHSPPVLSFPNQKIRGDETASCVFLLCRSPRRNSRERQRQKEREGPIVRKADREADRETKTERETD